MARAKPSTSTTPNSRTLRSTTKAMERDKGYSLRSRGSLTTGQSAYPANQVGKAKAAPRKTKSTGKGKRPEIKLESDKMASRRSGGSSTKAVNDNDSATNMRRRTRVIVELERVQRPCAQVPIASSSTVRPSKRKRKRNPDEGDSKSDYELEADVMPREGLEYESWTPPPKRPRRPLDSRTAAVEHHVPPGHGTPAPASPFPRQVAAEGGIHSLPSLHAAPKTEDHTDILVSTKAGPFPEVSFAPRSREDEIDLEFEGVDLDTLDFQYPDNEGEVEPEHTTV